MTVPCRHSLVSDSLQTKIPWIGKTNPRFFNAEPLGSRGHGEIKAMFHSAFFAFFAALR
jgi:hypothetical protein